MRNVLVCICCFFTFSMPTFAQDKKAQNIVEKYLEAIGGKNHLNKVKTWVITGNINIKKLRGNIVFFIKGTKYRFATNLYGEKYIEAYDGANLSIFDGKSLTVTGPVLKKSNGGNSVKDTLFASNFLGLIVPWKLLQQYKQEAVYDGLTIWKGKTVHQLHCLNGKNRTDYFFDQETYYLVKRSNAYGTASFINYAKRQSIGLWIPTLIDYLSKTAVHMELKGIKGNTQVSDSLFQIPPDHVARYEKLIKTGKKLPKDDRLSAEKIVNRYVRLFKKTPKFKTLIVEGKFVQDGMVMPFEMKGAKRRKYKLEVSVDGKVITKASNGYISWQLNPFVGNVAQRFQEDDDSPIDILYDYDLFNYKKSKSQIDYLSQEYVDGLLCHKIVFTHPLKGKRYYYLGQQDYLVHKVENLEKGRISFFGDFRQEKYGQAPYLLYISENLENGQKSKLIQYVDKYTFNALIDDKIFEFPGKKDASIKDKKK